jgi:hypothetical protein
MSQVDRQKSFGDQILLSGKRSIERGGGSSPIGQTLFRKSSRTGVERTYVFLSLVICTARISTLSVLILEQCRRAKSASPPELHRNRP